MFINVRSKVRYVGRLNSLSFTWFTQALQMKDKYNFFQGNATAFSQN
jgi:hypothetical protein